MRFRLKAKVILRVVRDGFARFTRLVAETGNSDEDLVFHVQKRQLDDLPDRTGEPRIVRGCKLTLASRRAPCQAL
jgi:hypothetical protein